MFITKSKVQNFDHVTYDIIGEIRFLEIKLQNAPESL